jgi:hypothetical protein
MRFGRVSGAVAITFLVSVVCLLPPGIHFVTGPLGPVIGGYVAGNRLRLTASESATTGLLIMIAVAALLIVSFEYLDIMPNLALQASIPLSTVGALYVGVLGGLGCWFASRATN